MSRARLLSAFLALVLAFSIIAGVPAAAGDVSIMAGNFLGQYFNNTSLSGIPALTRADAAVNFSWGNGSPDPTINADQFSARWTGSFPISSAGNYVFSLTVDDGGRLWVDGNLLIDRWYDQPPTTYTATVALTAATHTIKVEYYENAGQASVALAWGLAGSTNTFGAEYYNNMSLSGAPVLTRVDAAINFDWGYGSPAPVVNIDYFSARWIGTINFPATGDVDFHLYIDDGARLYLDGVLILDRWYPQAPTHHMTTNNVTAGVHEIKMEYFEEAGLAVAKLSWNPHAIVTEVIVDDLDPGFSKGGPFFSASIGYNSHMYWTRNAISIQENWGRWTPVLPAAGQYEVYVYVPSNNATTHNARYSVFHNDLWNTVSVNQSVYFNAWVSLGTFGFNASGAEFVFMPDITGEPYLSHRIGFDAVKFVYRGL